MIEAYLGSAAVSGSERGARRRRPAPSRCCASTAIETYYGAIQALKGISLEVREGEIVTLIGANGAGKSTTLRSINGLNHPRRGTIGFQGRRHHDDARPTRS